MSSTDPEPLPIRRLQESLINRIAAGEIIHRPASALKELIENCLDARSTSIRITVKEGGMKLLQIQDNGCGIRRSDLPILAERFTTSKLSSFSDLSRMTTYGFRGEALASMSHVAHLTVITKTKAEDCAWKACYSDGSLVPVKAGLTADPKPFAGNDGTMIMIENLFYNTPTRLSALRSAAEEYSRILDVVIKYAIHNPHVSFVCKKAGSPSPDLSTPSGSTTSQIIRQQYGTSVAKEILHAKRSSRAIDDEEEAMDDTSDDPEGWSLEASFTNINYQAKKMIFLLFINHRLVESSRIKRALEAVYSGLLPKGTSPFIYLSLLIDPRSVDVNVHPTKREVHFLNEETIIEAISETLQEALAGQSQSRAFEYQTLLTGGGSQPAGTQSISKKRKGKEREGMLDIEAAINNEDDFLMDEDSMPQSTQPESDPKKKILSQHKVRISLADRSLDSFFPVLDPNHIDGKSLEGNRKTDSSFSKSQSQRDAPTTTTAVIKESTCYLASVQTLRKVVQDGKHHALTEILEKHIFVGVVDLNRCLSLIQHSTKLYLVNHGALAEELFYQLGLRQFGNFTKLKLEPAPSLETLVKIAVEAEETTVDSRLSKSEIIDVIVKTLMSRRDMLSEYFSLNISKNGLVESLPLLLRGYIPNLDKLPSFLMRLGPQVNWTSEEECFESFLRELAYFYIPSPLGLDTSKMAGEDAKDKAEKWQIQHTIFATLRRNLDAPKDLLDQDVVQVASLPELYKVFERC